MLKQNFASAQLQKLANRSLELSNRQYQQRQITDKLFANRVRAKTPGLSLYAGYNAELGQAISKSNGQHIAGQSLAYTQQLAGAPVLVDSDTANIAWR